MLSDDDIFQDTLGSALSRRDINGFRLMLKSASVVEKMTVFEQACQMPGRAEFIRECIRVGCDVNKLNPIQHKRPIHFTIESYNHDNLDALLSNPHVNVDEKFMNSSPINYLVKYISDSNFDSVYPCIKLLVTHLADINIVGRNGMTPILNILKNEHLCEQKKIEIVRYFLKMADVDIDTLQDGEARTQLTALGLLDLELPPYRDQNALESFDFKRLMDCLCKENELEFLRGVNYIAQRQPDQLSDLFRKIDKSIDGTLMTLACKNGLESAVKRMLRLGADIYSKEAQMCPMETASRYGKWKIVDILLTSPKVNLHYAAEIGHIGAIEYLIEKGAKVDTKDDLGKTPLHLATENGHIEAIKCLIGNGASVDAKDFLQRTPLHYAAFEDNNEAFICLINFGATLNAEDTSERTPFQYAILKDKKNESKNDDEPKFELDPEILEKCFNACIKSNELRRTNDELEIEFDYTILNHYESFIECISDSKENKHLLKHPLISSYLELRWKQFAEIFTINCILCALFLLTTFLYILCYYNHPETSFVKVLMSVLMFILTILFGTLKVYQINISSGAYLKDFENYLEWILIVLVMMITFDIVPDWRQTICATSILLIVIEIFILAGSLPYASMSVHLVMFKKVTFSFLKSSFIYVLILFAFSYSLFTLYNETNNKNTVPYNNSKIDNNNNNERNYSNTTEEFEKKSSFGSSFLKILFMFTGTFGNIIDLEKQTPSYIVFHLIFSFFVMIILTNLLNTLAVSDIPTIKSEAELTHLIRRVEVIARYNNLPRNWFTQGWKSLFKQNTSNELNGIGKIQIKPNKNNQIVIQYNARDYPGLESGQCEENKISNHTIDSETLELAFQRLDTKKKEKRIENEKEKYNKIIAKLEVTSKTISDKQNEKFASNEEHLKTITDKQHEENERIKATLAKITEKQQDENEKFARIEENLKTITEKQLEENGRLAGIEATLETITAELNRHFKKN